MTGHVIALCGGVGGAKLAFGLTKILDPGDLTLVVNTGDDFCHLGLQICPDLDTVAYTLAGLSDRERGWGMAGETWNFMAALRRLGGESWFQLGDQDLAIHVERSRRAAKGDTLSQITTDLTAALGISHAVVPMSDQPVKTIIQTATGELAFQRYFVAEACRPAATGVRFEGADAASASPALLTALMRRDVSAVVICPSNPYLSIDPILSIPGVREGLAAIGAPVVAVSPIVGGEAIKGPAAKLMRELGACPGALAVANHYRGLVDGLVIDRTDAAEAGALRVAGVSPLVTDSIMKTDADRICLAIQTLELASRLDARTRQAAT